MSREEELFGKVSKMEQSYPRLRRWESLPHGAKTRRHDGAHFMWGAWCDMAVSTYLRNFNVLYGNLLSPHSFESSSSISSSLLNSVPSTGKENLRHISLSRKVGRLQRPGCWRCRYKWLHRDFPMQGGTCRKLSLLWGRVSL